MHHRVATIHIPSGAKIHIFQHYGNMFSKEIKYLLPISTLSKKCDPITSFPIIPPQTL